MQSLLDNLRSKIERLEIQQAPDALPDTEQLWAGYTPLPVALPFHASNSRYKTIYAGVQSGKSYTADREFFKLIYEDRAIKSGPLQYWAVAPTYPLTRRQEFLIRQFLNPLGLIIGETKSERIIRLKGGIVIQFKTGDRPDLLVAEPVDGMWIDEAARLKESAWTDNLEGRTTSTLGWSLFTTASKGRNWFYKTLIKPAEQGDRDYFALNWRTVDNISIPGIQEEVARKKRTLPAKLFKREYEASLDAFEGQIYEEWSEKTHVFSGDPPPFKSVSYGYDWGKRNPGVLLAVGEDGDGRLWVVDELARTGQTLAAWAVYAAEMQGRWERGILYYDPSMGDSSDEFGQGGVYAEKANNAVGLGIDACMKALHPVEQPVGKDGKAVAALPGLMVHERCELLREEMPAYRWGPSEQPVKENDHALDALRYAVYSPRVGMIRAY